MTFENPNLNSGAEQNSEIEGEIKNLDKKAGDVAEELESVDLENVETADKWKIISKLMIIAGALGTIAGVTVGYNEMPFFSALDINNIGNSLKTLQNSGVFNDAAIALAGMGVFLQGLGNLRKILTKEQNEKEDPGV